MANEEVQILERTYTDPNEEIKLGPYLVRESFFQRLIHSQDEIKNVGYQWRPNLMKKSLSTYLLSNTNTSEMVERYRNLMVFLIDKIQDIKKAFNYTVDKHFKYIS